MFDRRKRDRDIAAELDQHAAGTDRHDRPELRIAPHADEELELARAHGLDEAALDSGTRQAACERRHDLAPGVLEGAPLRQAELDGAHLALVHELPANGLERHRIADPLRRLDRPLERGAHLFAGDLDAVARDEALGLRLGQPALRNSGEDARIRQIARRGSGSPGSVAASLRLSMSAPSTRKALSKFSK